ERVATLREELGACMEKDVGIFRTETGLREACAKMAELRERYRRGIKLDDHSLCFNTEWLETIELGFMLEVAEAMAWSALERRESRGAHQRLDEGMTERDDEHFLKHSLAIYNGDGRPSISYQPVVITKSKPGKRVYGGAGKQAVLT
ncbi:MAG: succinate dehydrogenase/fumarate reductase flavoprotein subunit, partial [Acetobacteraceae bacterium]|nr:succinate dehydrogenase/fumarate reductase flavoprotein subunit [Acetobacteraceae bacterium]